MRTARFAATVGGGAVITAVAASRLGLRTSVLSALGPDAVKRLRDEHVGVVNLIRRGEAPAFTVALSTPSDRSFVTFDGANEHLERRLAARAGRLRAPFVHLAFAPKDCSHWARIVTALRKRGVTTSWDFGWHHDLASRRGIRALIASVDYLFMNEQEAAMYPWKRRAGHTIVKLGARGSRWIGPQFEVRVPAVRVTPVDTTGAGDAFNGAFLVGLARGLSASDCLRLANGVGAASTQAAGGLDGLPRRSIRPNPSSRR
jgi:ribokinase